MPLATPEELEKYPPPPLPKWVTHFNLLPRPEYQIQFLNKGKGGKPGEPYWVSNYGAQTWALMCPFDEILIGGARGGAKSACLIAWFAMGDPSLTPDDPARYSYLLEPTFRGLMLRKEYIALAEFVDEAEEFFRPLGGKRKDDPAVFTFPSGAKIYTNHLGDANAFEKYRGQGITKIGIEELTQIEGEQWYLKLFGSLRAKRQVRVHNGKKFRALRSQIMSTTNPDGPGSPWVKRRFVKVYNGAGKLIEWNTPMIDHFTGLSRVFIPMARKDNPYLRSNKQYEGMIMAQNETTRLQWQGSWDAGTGVFFGDFRPRGPVGDEEKRDYPNARHVVDAAELKPWWYRWGSGDHGYEHWAAFHKFCRSEKDGRVHIYDELKLRKTGSFELGVRVAEWWIPDLERLPDKSITLTYSHEAFHKDDAGHTKADEFLEGIKSVLGPYGAFLMKYSDEELETMRRDPEVAAQMFNRRRMEHSQGRMAINVKMSSRDRSGGFSYMRDLLRFRPVLVETEEQLSRRLMETFQRGGVEAYERERSKVKRPVDEALPKLILWARCAGLIRCIEESVQDPDNPEEVLKKDADENGVGGDDELDSARYGLKEFKEVEKTMPKIYYVSEQMERIQTQQKENTGSEITDINRLIMIRKTQENRYDHQHPIQTRFNPPRASGGRHRARAFPRR